MIRRLGARWPWVILSLVAGSALVSQGNGAASPTGRAGAAIDRAVAYLAAAQQADGGFLMERCPDATLTNCSLDRSPATQPIMDSLATSVVLAGLSGARDPRALRLRAQGGRFLAAQMDRDGWFGAYRLRDAERGAQCPGEFRQLELTCVQRLALEPLTPQLSPILPQLMAYRNQAGLFYPFAIAPEQAEGLSRRDAAAQEGFAEAHPELMRDYAPMMLELSNRVDPLVNAEVLAYLARHGVAAPAVCDYLAQQLAQGLDGLTSVFADGPFHAAHAISGAYAGGAACLAPIRSRLETLLLDAQQPDGGWGHAVDTALAADSLMQLGYRGPALDRAAGALIAFQQPDGRWPRIAWRRLKGHPFWFVSDEAVAGMAVAALTRYAELEGGR